MRPSPRTHNAPVYQISTQAQWSFLTDLHVHHPNFRRWIYATLWRWLDRTIQNGRTAHSNCCFFCAVHKYFYLLTYLHQIWGGHKLVIGASRMFWISDALLRFKTRARQMGPRTSRPNVGLCHLFKIKRGVGEMSDLPLNHGTELLQSRPTVCYPLCYRHWIFKGAIAMKRQWPIAQSRRYRQCSKLHTPYFTQLITSRIPSTCSPCRTGSEIGGDYRFLAATGVATMSWRNGDRLRRLLSRCSMAVGGASMMMTVPLPTLLATSLCLRNQRRVRRTRTTLSPSHD